MAINLTGEIKPTDEQRAAITLFAEGDNLAIEAGAGTGKTSTLKMLGKYNKDRGQYLAFNKAIVEEAKEKFPSNIRCNTAHSIAFGAVGNRYKARLFNGQRVKSVDVGRYLAFRPMNFTVGEGRKIFSVSQMGSLVTRTIGRFCQSADLEISKYHIPYVDGIDMPSDKGRGWDNNNKLRDYIFPALDKAWEDLQRTEGGFLQFKHEHYLKLFQLDDPVINASFILFDEAQDANPVILDIVKRQEHAQLVFVGDSQQAIYGFTGAINAMQEIPSDSRTFLTQSFRFGPEVAGVANRILGWLNADLRIVGFDKVPSIVREIDLRTENADVILTRTNAMAIRHCLGLQAQGKRVALVGGAKDLVSFARAAQDLMMRRPTYHPELACFADWAEVREYVAFDEDGSDLKLMVDLIDQFGCEKIITALTLCDGKEESADVVVSTAHKAKGREWDKVKLSSDFPTMEKMGAEEMRLLYVAVTRAKLVLDISLVDCLAF